MRDRWMNTGCEDTVLEPYIEPEQNADEKRIGNVCCVPACVCVSCALGDYRSCGIGFNCLGLVFRSLVLATVSQPVALGSSDLCNYLFLLVVATFLLPWYDHMRIFMKTVCHCQTRKLFSTSNRDLFLSNKRFV